MIDKNSKQYLNRLKELEKLGEQIRSQTAPMLETPEAKRSRIQRMLTTGWDGFQEYAHYYFGMYIDSDFGWFHKELDF